MANYGSKDIGFLLVDGRDILSNVLGLTVNGSEPVIDKMSPFGSPWPIAKDTGERTSLGASLDVLYDDAANSTNSLIAGQQGVSRVWMWNVTGNAIGRRFVGHGAALTGKVKRVLSEGKLHRGTLPLEGSGPTKEGIVLHAHQQESAAGNTQASSHDWTTEARAVTLPISGVSVANPSVITCPVPHGLTTGQVVKIAGTTTTPTINGVQTITVVSPTQFSIPVTVTVVTVGTGTFQIASGVVGATGYLGVSQIALGGYTSVTFKVRHSADNVTWADLITFANVSAIGAQAVDVAGTINQFTASSWALNGAGAGPTFTFMIGLARNDANT